MKNVLGLDISTSKIGWAVIQKDENNPILGYIDVGKKKTLFEKANFAKVELEKIILENEVNKIYIEEDLQRFRKGFSSAKTIQKLSKFNGIISYVVYQILKEAPASINVNEARKISNCKIDKKDKTRTTKEKVFTWVDQKINYSWPMKTLKSGPRKGEEILDGGCYDMSDAYIIALASLKISDE
jgi:Holliday junction resolvasome RuvABC endonuclease subunit